MTPRAKIHTRAVALQQIRTQVPSGRNRLQAILNPKQVRDEQPVLLRHRRVPTGTIHRHIEPSISGSVVMKVLDQHRGRSQVCVVPFGNLIKRVARLWNISENVAQELCHGCSRS